MVEATYKITIDGHKMVLSEEDAITLWGELDYALSPVLYPEPSISESPTVTVNSPDGYPWRYKCDIKGGHLG